MRALECALSDERAEFFRGELDALYARYNRREWVHPDPLGFLYPYEAPSDREIAGLIASSLAYGRVAQIHRSASYVLDRMGLSPSRFLQDASLGSLRKVFSSFKHRFTTGDDLAALLFGARKLVERYGSLEGCFMAGCSPDDASVFPALSRFVEKFSLGGEPSAGMLLPSPARGSACKRLHLFLRWMVRRDEVDPGGWDGVQASRLITPLDTHMHRVGLLLGLTRRRHADLRTALEITTSFKKINPEDPVRYDFTLTRAGILDNRELQERLMRLARRS
jgi:uncharacterized protein (TIGR02757 family)